jgi:hypothetical protein
VASFTASGEFISKSETKSQTSWGTTTTTTESASSAIGQAQRQANNNAIREIHKLIIHQAALAKR